MNSHTLSYFSICCNEFLLLYEHMPVSIGLHFKKNKNGWKTQKQRSTKDFCQFLELVAEENCLFFYKFSIHTRKKMFYFEKSINK